MFVGGLGAPEEGFGSAVAEGPGRTGDAFLDGCLDKVEVRPVLCLEVNHVWIVVEVCKRKNLMRFHTPCVGARAYTHTHTHANVWT